MGLFSWNCKCCNMSAKSEAALNNDDGPITEIAEQHFVVAVCGLVDEGVSPTSVPLAEIVKDFRERMEGLS